MNSNLIRLCCRLARYFMAGLLAIGLTGCASLATRLPAASAEAVESEKAAQTQTALQIYQDMNARLQTIARPILRENARLCQKTREDIGVQTARLKTYPEALRDEAKQSLGLTDKHQVIFVHAGQPDIKVGDQFLKGGKAVSAQSINYKLDDVKVKRGASEMALETGFDQTICDYPVTLKYSTAINAYATGKSIIVTTAMMGFTNDDELALVIGHELAHNTQSHVRKVIQNRILGLGFGLFTRQFESEADYIGLYYMARAGYEPEGAIGFWRRLAEISVKALYEAKSHPLTAERYVRLEGALQEIQSKQAAQSSLVPELRNQPKG